MKKTLATLLAVILCLTMLAPMAIAEEYGYATNIIGDGSQTLSLTCYQNWDAAAYYDSEEGLLIPNVIEEITGVKIDWECIPDANYDVVAQTRLAAGIDLPDIMRVPVVTGALIKYADEGLFINLSEYISEENTPNIWKRFQESPYLQAISTAPDGNVYGLPYTEIGTNDIMVHWVDIRKDWLDNLGLEMPTTLEEYHDVLVAFKEQDANGNGDPNDEIPLGYQNEGMFGLFAFKGCFGLSYGADKWYVDENGKVQLALVDSRLKDMYKMLNDWYNEGLLYTDVSNTGWQDLVAQDRLGSQTLLALDNVMTNQGLAYDITPEAEYVYIPLLDNAGYYNGTSVPQDQKELDKRSNGYWGYFAVTADCEDPLLAVKWLDYVWGSQESQDLRYWGIEGVTYDVVDGQKVWTGVMSIGTNVGDFESTFPQGKALTAPFRQGGCCEGVVLFCDLGQLALFLGLAELLQLGYQHQADQRCGEAAVVQAEAAVHIRYAGNQQIVQSCGQYAVAKAISTGDGAEAIGIAQTDQNGLVGNGQRIALHTQQTGDPAEQVAGQHIAHHNGQHIPGMGAGVAGTEHTEHDAEGHTGPHILAAVQKAGQVEVGHDHQSVHAHIHQEGCSAVLGREADTLAGVLHQRPVGLGSAAHQQCKHNAKAKQRAAEGVGSHGGGYLRRSQGGQFQARGGVGAQHYIVKHCPQEECGKADGNGGGVVVKALVDIGCVTQACRQEETDDAANHDRQNNAQSVEADVLCAGVAEQQIGDQRCNAGGEHHSVHIRGQFFFLYQAVKGNTQHCGEHI